MISSPPGPRWSDPTLGNGMCGAAGADQILELLLRDCLRCYDSTHIALDMNTACRSVGEREMRGGLDEDSSCGASITGSSS